MTLRNFGGIHQFVVASAEDLARIDLIDAARWAATSAPLRDLHCDDGFLAFVDSDGKGRIRVAELLRARDWAFARLSDRAGLGEKSDVLQLGRIDQAGEAGKKLFGSATHVLKELGRGGDTKIALADVRGFRAGYAKTLRNGDGVVPAELVSDPEVQQLIKDVIAVVGSTPDASGNAGVNEALLAKYLDGAKGFLAWALKGKTNAQIFPLAGETGAAVAAIAAVDAKIEEFFLRSDLLRQEHLTPERLKLTDAEIDALKGKDAAALTAWLAASSFAPLNVAGTLAVGAAVNPSFQTAWDTLHTAVLAKLPGTQKLQHLDRATWQKVKGEFEAHLAWNKEKPAQPYDTIPAGRLEALETGPLPGKLRDLFASDLAAAPELAQVVELEKLILFQRWLVELANNFVNFSAVYSPSQTALVEMGSIVIDGRRLEFCTKVEDRAAHKKIAAESLIFLVYAQITDQDGKGAAFEVVAPVTAGERGRLRIGKRGIFVDNLGKEWDATVIEIVEHGISIKEAALAPFRRAQKFIAERIESLVASQQAAQEKSLMTAASSGVDHASTTVQKAAAAPPPPPAAPAPAPAPAPAAGGGGGGMQALMIGGSLAFAALTSALAYVVSAVTSIAPLKLIGGVAGLVLAVAGISALLGWLKLRRRDMGLLFEASGWAINAEMKITRRLGVTFTRTPGFPEGTRIDRLDILAQDPEVVAQDAKRAKTRRRFYTTLFLVLAAAGGFWWLWAHNFYR
jgi:hypothetical protein